MLSSILLTESSEDPLIWVFKRILDKYLKVLFRENMLY